MTEIIIGSDHLINKIYKNQNGDIERIRLIRNGIFTNLIKDVTVRD